MMTHKFLTKVVFFYYINFSIHISSGWNQP